MAFLTILCFLLSKSVLTNGKNLDCANAFELKNVLVNETFLLDVNTDHDQVHVMVLKVSSGGDKTPIMSVNVDTNSVSNITFWGSLGMDYESRISVHRTATKPGEPQYIRITIRAVKHDDAGTYSVEVENTHSRTEKCFRVYVHGPPTTPKLVLVSGDCSYTEGSCARFICMSNLTTTPRNPDVPLRYTYSINGSSPDVDSDSRYMMQNNELMIGGLTKADDNLIVTCEVQEENGHPKKVSTTYTLSVLPSDPSSELGTIGRQSLENSDDGTLVAMKGTEGSNAGWIAGIVVLSVLLTASGIAHAVKYCKGNKQSRPLGTAGEPRKLNKTELDAPGSFSVP